MEKVQTTSFTLPFRGAQTTVMADVRRGGTDLLLFIHGLGCSRTSFSDVWGRPEFESFSMVCLDLPGFGQSEDSEHFTYLMEDHALICANVISQFSARRVHLVGHSMGGAIGLLLPPTALASVYSFFNVEGNLNPEDCIFGSRRAVDASYDSFMLDVLPDFKRSSATWRKSGLDVASPRAFYRSARSLVEWSDNGKLLSAFHALSCRKIYVYGEENRHHPTVSTVTGIDRIEIPGAGHFVMNDNPDAFYSHLLDFVRET